MVALHMYMIYFSLTMMVDDLYVSYIQLNQIIKNQEAKPYCNFYAVKYIVEMKDKLLVDWQVVTETKDAECTAVVNGLREKQTYQFRIVAVNKAGKSE